ncbi:hypothetical protein EDB86DRAFT_2835095 [Lactarius hatsudake]|nr:hypothetical protein EDB86DRAFT_2835095 [Lactarius hatsudake]
MLAQAATKAITPHRVVGNSLLLLHGITFKWVSNQPLVEKVLMKYIVMDLWDQSAGDSPPLRRPYGYIFIIDHPSWTSITALDEAPAGIPQAKDLHAFITLNGDLAPHPAEYTDAITNRLFYRPFRIAATNEA